MCQLSKEKSSLLLESESYLLLSRVAATILLKKASERNIKRKYRDKAQVKALYTSELIYRGQLIPIIVGWIIIY